MEILLTIILILPAALWALGGFKMADLAREMPKLIGWYVVVGGLYLIFV